MGLARGPVLVQSSPRFPGIVIAFSITTLFLAQEPITSALQCSCPHEGQR